ncbi:uncharacterized protein F5147DRAFT_655552 [Suillus discolor]|uniref:Uncharacterized protein n=1 Tax=Suillus discolor TaxID=1912936 RepID=A0A9P7F1Y3_9AGAM|nr:uncharacterized protein F5147DRAFT_655552 [Suillus discolor]KAG2100434.1 hypothetical protein F5147DRAFT_655552 [Suillus discolor]
MTMQLMVVTVLSLVMICIHASAHISSAELPLISKDCESSYVETALKVLGKLDVIEIDDGAADIISVDTEALGVGAVVDCWTTDDVVPAAGSTEGSGSSLETVYQTFFH